MNKPAGTHWQGPQDVRVIGVRVYMAVISTGHLATRSSLPCAQRLLQPSEGDNFLTRGQLHIPAHLLQGSLLLSMAWSGCASLCRNSLWCQNNPHGAESGSLASSSGFKCVPLPTFLPHLTQSHGLGFSLPYLFVHPFKRCNMLGRHCRHRSR